MDQIKIGAFIAECRKKRGWTQNQLAEQLGLTGKAVSKWETGRSMPDLSVFSPLCSLLEISVNELMAGAYISEEELRSKTDEVLMEVITNWLGQEERERKEIGKKSESILKVSNVSKIYETENGKTLAVDDISFEVQQGSFVGIMGKSGSGKTTLLNLIATIDKPNDGKVDIGGHVITDMTESKTAQFRREHLGFIFQEYNLLDTLTIYENIALALTVKDTLRENRDQIISELAERLAITSVLDRYPYEVSGGQRQRCACARAVAAKPDIVLADEPTGALDSHAARQLLDIFVMLCREYGTTILMVTHDVLSASYCDRILFMQDGRIEASLSRGQMSRPDFLTKILEKIVWMEEGGNVF